MRMVNPTAMATILRLIDCLIIDPEKFFKFLRLKVFEMSLPPSERSVDFRVIFVQDPDFNFAEGKFA